MKKEKSIVFVIGSLGKGGAERVISTLANHYCKMGYNTSIVLLLDNTVEYIMDDRIEIIDVSNREVSRLRLLPVWIKKMREVFSQKKPSVVVSFVARINIISIVSSIGFKHKLVISERNDPMKDGRSVIVKALTKLLYPAADTIVFQTKWVQNQFPRKIVSKSVNIPNPVKITTERKNVVNNSIVSVGRLEPQKNQSLLIEAFSNIVKIYPEYTLYIYGEGDLRHLLESEIKNRKMENNIFLPGVIDDIHQRISSDKIFVLSSDYEGLSNALLEAQMMGFPCVSTNCSGIDEFITDGVNGLLVEVGNSSDLENAILKLIKNESLSNLLSKNAKDLSLNYSFDNIISKWDKVILMEEEYE